MYIIQKGFADEVAVEKLSAFLSAAVAFVAKTAPAAVAELEDTKQLTAAVEKQFTEALSLYKMKNQ